MYDMRVYADVQTIFKHSLCKEKKLFLGPAGRLMGVYASFCLCYYRTSVLVSAEIYTYIHLVSTPKAFHGH